ncbi:MAG: hypothetical protein KBT06_11670 [Prevotellaceae bacterium]|nr:hypothetical protein [Candidatus Colivivens equi]
MKQNEHKYYSRLDEQIISSDWTDSKTGQNVHTETIFANLTDDEKRMWYSGLCSNEEIERILHVQNAQDYILKLRADAIVDSIRLTRVFTHLRHFYKNKWSLSSYFRAYEYESVKSKMSPEHRSLCEQVACGSLIESEANGLIFDSPYGICSTYSHSLQYFSKFALLALLSFDKDVPMEVRMNAMRISVRTMLQRETLDFIVDPRGIVPRSIMQRLQSIYATQMEFLVGHEYSHLINGDLTRENLVERSLIHSRFKDQTDYKLINAYNSSQRQEFAADLGSLSYPLWKADEYDWLYYCTMLWFSILAIYEAVENTIFPPIGYQSHPGAKARYNNILTNAKRPTNFDEYFYFESLPERVSDWEELMIEDASLNFDELYNMYGSVYLAAPNTEWRGRQLIDRVDY